MAEQKENLRNVHPRAQLNLDKSIEISKFSTLSNKHPLESNTNLRPLSSSLQRLINKIMIKGKKGLAERIFFQSLTEIATKTGKNPYEVALQAIESVKPYVEVKSIRVAGSTYMVPVEISEHRQISLAIRWIVNNARLRNERHMYKKLASELLDAYNRTGASIKKKEELHKMAEANRAFSHYRW